MLFHVSQPRVYLNFDFFNIFFKLKLNVKPEAP